MADWTANSDFGSLAATREPILRSPREPAPAGLRAEPRVAREETPRLSPGVAALAQYNAGHNGPMAKAGLAVWAGGGVLSLALMAGLGVWGYKLVLREVMGLPVVEAEDGPMRVLPADPQGEVVPSQGLAVNAIPAAGTAAPPSDVLVLAPQGSGLAEEDLEVVQTRAEAGEVMPASVVSAVAADPLALVEARAEPPAPQPAAALLPSPAPAAAPTDMHAGTDMSGSMEMTPEDMDAMEMTTMEVAGPATAAPAAAIVLPNRAMTAEEILALADQIASGSLPLTAAAPLAPAAAALATQAPSAPLDTTLAAAAAIPVAPASATFSVRPPLRPAALGTPPAAALAAAAAAPVAAAAERAPTLAVANTPVLPAGTNLVQLGAFDSAEIAAAEWGRLQTRFGEFLGSKERVIQEAQSEGRTFFRLRALGFADRADARRLCAALTAEDAACIPVTVD